MAKMTEKKLKALVSEAFYKVGTNRQFMIMDTPKIMAAGMEAGRNGQDIEAAVAAACDKYECKKDVVAS
jgi:hypothetical protein